MSIRRVVSMNKQKQRLTNTQKSQRDYMKKKDVEVIVELIKEEAEVAEEQHPMTNSSKDSRISVVKDIRSKQEFRLSNAMKTSKTLSDINRYLVFTGFVVIWALLSDDSRIVKLTNEPYLKWAILVFCIAIVCEYVHYLTCVSSNLYYGTYKLINKRTYDKSNRTSNKVASTFPPFWERIQWTLWYLKVFLMCIGYILIIMFLI